MIRIIHVNKQAIPYTADIRLAGETFTFTFNYNAEGDFFSIDLAKDDEVLCRGEKITYSRALFQAVATEAFPKTVIVPLDRAGESKRVGWQDLGENVFLYVMNPEEL